VSGDTKLSSTVDAPSKRLVNGFALIVGEAEAPQSLVPADSSPFDAQRIAQTRELAYLEVSDAYIARGEQVVTKQKIALGRLLASGRDATTARRTLDGSEARLAQFNFHRQMVVEGLKVSAHNGVATTPRHPTAPMRNARGNSARSAADCRQLAEHWQAQARNPRLPQDVRAALRHLADCWWVCADASALLEWQAGAPPSAPRRAIED
jgi:hypothetical protein